MIDGAAVKRLKLIPDERGRLMEILRCDEDLFVRFGQVYMTTTYPQVVKAWHYHKVQDDFITCVRGMLKLVLYDDRDGSPTLGEINEFFWATITLSSLKCRRWSTTDGNAYPPRRRSSSTCPRNLIIRALPTSTGWTPITTVFPTGG